jgi:hypothetical protein
VAEVPGGVAVFAAVLLASFIDAAALAALLASFDDADALLESVPALVASLAESEAAGLASESGGRGAVDCMATLSWADG